MLLAPLCHTCPSRITEITSTVPNHGAALCIHPTSHKAHTALAFLQPAHLPQTQKPFYSLPSPAGQVVGLLLSAQMFPIGSMVMAGKMLKPLLNSVQAAAISAVCDPVTSPFDSGAAKSLRTAFYNNTSQAGGS